MAKSSSDASSAQDANLKAVAVPREPAVDFSQVLVIGKSQVNRVVISKIIEKSGLKPVSETPEAALKALQSMCPGVVVLDGGTGNDDCDCLMERLIALRAVGRNNAPSIILLSVKNIGVDKLATQADAVVPKPITTELLQPVIDRMLKRARCLI